MGGKRRMKGKGTFRRNGFTLAPRDRWARELLSGVKEGGDVFVELWNPRNMVQHRKYFAILNNVVEATGRWASTEALRRDVLLTLGRFDEHVNQLTGEVSKVPHSMKVASMAKAEFEQLYRETIALLTDALGADPEMLTQEAA